MKDFKTLPKMQCGGKVKKYSGADSSYVESTPRQNFTTRKPINIAELQAQSAANSRQVPRKPVNLTQTFDTKQITKRTGGSVKRKK